MGLEHIVMALGAVMKDKLDSVDSGVLKRREVQDTLTTFFAEQQVRPELVAQIRATSLMYEYLQLSLEEREEIEGFMRKYPGYILGDEDELRGGRTNHLEQLKKGSEVIRKQRYTQQLLKLFIFFLQTRKEGEVFNTNYLKRNNQLKAKFGRLGSNLYQNALSNLKDEGGFDKLIELASEVNPEIKRYSDRIEVFKIDGSKQLLRIFEFFLKTREEGDVLNTGYLETNKQLKAQFSGLGDNLYENARNNLKDQGGIDYLVQLTGRERPEILQYWQYNKRRGRRREK